MLIPSSELNELFTKALKYGLHERRSALTKGIDAAFVANLELDRYPNSQLWSDLCAMNVIDRVVGSGIPLKQWLETADALIGVQTTDFGDLAKRIVSKPDPSPFDSKERAQTTLENLQSLAGSSDTFRRSLAAASHQFEAVAEKVRLLMAYKGLHDFLHDIQVFKLHLLQATLPPGPPSANWAALLGPTVYELEFKLGDAVTDKLSMLQAGSRVRQDEERWLEELGRIFQGFKEAIQSGSVEPGRVALFNLRQLLRHNMSRLNLRLYDAAGQLDIGGLVDRLRSFAASLTDDDPKAEPDPRADQIRGAATQLLALRSEIDTLLAEHDSWQQIDDRLWTAEDSLLVGGDLALINFAQIWPCVVEQVTRIAGPGTAEWYLRAQHFAVSFGTSCPLPVVPPIAGGALDDFREFTKSARNQFYDVDTQLKLRCSRLTQIAKPLEELARLQ